MYLPFISKHNSGLRDFPIPAFAAFLSFELHENENGSFYVKILYNPGSIFDYLFPRAPQNFLSRSDPEIYGIPGSEDGKEYLPCNYFRIPGVRQVADWEERIEGTMTLEGLNAVFHFCFVSLKHLLEFEHIMMNDRASFENEQAWAIARDNAGRRNSFYGVNETVSCYLYDMTSIYPTKTDFCKIHGRDCSSNASTLR